MPQPESFAKCSCQHCGGHIAFPVQGAGQSICCPHCNKPTLLPLSFTPPVEVGGGPATQKRIYLLFAIAAAVVLAAGGIAYFCLSNSRLQPGAPARPGQPSDGGRAASAPVLPPKSEPPPDPWHGLKAGEVTLEKSGDGRLIYAVGTLTNDTTRQRFGVKVELEVLDAQHDKLGSATDYADVIEPGKEWTFRAMVTDKTAAAANLTKVTEQE